MSFSIKTIAAFEKEIKALAKKYRSIRSDFITLLELLEKDPAIGTPLEKLFQDQNEYFIQNKGEKWWSKGNYLCQNCKKNSLPDSHL